MHLGHLGRLSIRREFDISANEGRGGERRGEEMEGGEEDVRHGSNKLKMSVGGVRCMVVR